MTSIKVYIYFNYINILVKISLKAIFYRGNDSRLYPKIMIIQPIQRDKKKMSTLHLGQYSFSHKEHFFYIKK